MFDFQPKGKTWEERSELKGFQAVLDPEGSKIKNEMIDVIHKKAMEDVFLSIKERCVCLDFGCGIGRLYEFLSSYFSNYIGVDVTEEMIEKARLYHAGVGEFYSFNGISLPLDDNSVDVVVSVLVLQHINNQEEYCLIIDSFSRIIKSGGYVVILEQLSDEKKARNYIDPFEAKGFTLITQRTIRYGKSISSKLSNLSIFRKLSYRWVAVCLASINRFELFFPPIKRSYEETVFVLKRGNK